MDKEIIEIPKLSDAIRKVGVPLSTCVKAGDFLFVSGLPPLDLDTGKMVQGGVAAQTEQVLKNIQHTLESAGSSLDRRTRYWNQASPQCVSAIAVPGASYQAASLPSGPRHTAVSSAVRDPALLSCTATPVLGGSMESYG